MVQFAKCASSRMQAATLTVACTDLVHPSAAEPMLRGGCNLAQPNLDSKNIVFRIPTPIFGAGLIAGIRDSTIRGNMADNSGQGVRRSEANQVVANFKALSPIQQEEVIIFLRSL